MTTTPRTPGSWARTMRTGAQGRSREAIMSLLVTSCHVISWPGLIQQQLSINIHCFVSSRVLQFWHRHCSIIKQYFEEVPASAFSLFKVPNSAVTLQNIISKGTRRCLLQRVCIDVVSMLNWRTLPRSDHDTIVWCRMQTFCSHFNYIPPWHLPLNLPQYLEFVHYKNI